MSLPLLTATLLAALSLGDDKPPAPSLADRYQQIVREFEEGQAKAREAAMKAPSREEGHQILRQMSPDQIAFDRRLIDLAETSPRDPAARDALVRAVGDLSNPDEAWGGAQLSRAIDLLVEHHADDPEVARLGLGMDNIISRRRDAFLEGIYANAEGHWAKGMARLALARYLERKAKFAATAKRIQGRTTITHRGTDAQGKRVELKRPMPNDQEGYLVGLRLLDPDTLRREAERLYREVAAEYGDVPYITTGRLRREARLRAHPPEAIDNPAARAAAERSARALEGPPQTLADVATDRLTAIYRPNVVEKGAEPAVGMPAPDIDGPGLDGKPLKLSDYRGKVVVLVFWGSWCKPCMAEVPHEREMVERLKGRPFALLGVVCDEKAPAQHAIETERMTWPHWYGNGITGRYRVTAFPTVVVIDARGIIRSQKARGAELDKLVDDLLKDAESK